MKDEVKRTDKVVHGAEKLFTAEQSIRTAMSDTAALISCLSQMSAEGDISIMVGQTAFEEAAATFMALTTARGAIVRTHNELDLAKTQIGCGAVAVGGTFGKPPKDGDATLIQPRRAA